MQLGLAQLLAHDVQRLVQRAQHAAAALGVGLGGNIHGDHDVRAHLARGVHRHRADQAAIDIFAPLNQHRLEHRRHGGRGAHRLAGVATAEHHAVAVGQIGGHRAKRPRQFFNRQIAHLLIDIALQLFALHKAAVAQHQIADRRRVQRQRHVLQLDAAVAGGVQAAHHCAGAGAGDDVRADAV